MYRAVILIIVRLAHKAHMVQLLSRKNDWTLRRNIVHYIT